MPCKCPPRLLAKLLCQVSQPPGSHGNHVSTRSTLPTILCSTQQAHDSSHVSLYYHGELSLKLCSPCFSREGAQASFPPPFCILRQRSHHKNIFLFWWLSVFTTYQNNVLLSFMGSLPSLKKVLSQNNFGYIY